MIELIKKRKYKAGYHIHYMRVSGEDAGGGPEFIMRKAHTPDGLYVGNVRIARFLIVKKGINPELSSPDHCVCSIGFCESDGKWYGWSHRAIAGFEIGDRLFDAEWPGATDETPYAEHGSMVIKSIEGARRSAVNFAAYVS